MYLEFCLYFLGRNKKGTAFAETKLIYYYTNFLMLVGSFKIVMNKFIVLRFGRYRLVICLVR